MDNPGALWSIAFHPKAEKFLRRLATRDRHLLEKYIEKFEALCRNPYIGDPKHGDLRGVLGLHISGRDGTHCIAYSINEEKKRVLILLCGPHEGFYNILRGITC